MSSITGRMKTRPQRARAAEDPYQSASSEEDQATDDVTSPSAPNTNNNKDRSTHHNSDVSSNDPHGQPQDKLKPKILDPIKEANLQQLESKIQEMEMAKKSLPAMSSALENIQDILTLMKTTANVRTPVLDTQPREDVSDTSD